MGEVTLEGEQLVKSWRYAQERLAQAKSEVNRAECDVLNTTNALGRWLAPGDAKAGETFCVWYGDSLIQCFVRYAPSDGVAGDFEITVRKRGRSLIRA